MFCILGRGCYRTSKIGVKKEYAMHMCGPDEKFTILCTLCKPNLDRSREGISRGSSVKEKALRFGGG